MYVNTNKISDAAIVSLLRSVLIVVVGYFSLYPSLAAAVDVPTSPYTLAWTTQISGQGKSVHKIALTRDGKHLAVSSINERLLVPGKPVPRRRQYVHILDATTGAEVTRIECDYMVVGLEFSPDGRHLLMHGGAGPASPFVVETYQFGKGKLSRSTRTVGPMTATYAADQAAFLYRRGPAKIDEGRTEVIWQGKTIASLIGHHWGRSAGTAEYLAVAKQSSRESGKVYVRNLSSGSHSFIDTRGGAIRTSPDGRYLASFSFSEDSRIDIIGLTPTGPSDPFTVDVAEGAAPDRWVNAVRALAFLPGSSFAFSSGHELSIFNWKEKRTFQTLLRAIPRQGEAIHDCVASNDGTCLATVTTSAFHRPTPPEDNIYFFRRTTDARPPLTVITHGWRPEVEPRPDWHTAMELAVEQRVRRKFGLDASTAARLAVRYDWHEASQNFAEGWAEAAGDELFARTMANLLSRGGKYRQGSFAALVDLHFIGHSRGTSVNSEAVRRLGQYDIRVAQMTVLDWPSDGVLSSLPDDPAPRVWENVEWCDNYFAGGRSVSGSDLDGAFINKSLKAAFAACPPDVTVPAPKLVLSATAFQHHAGAHDWYHGTILLQNPPVPDAVANDDGSGSPSLWYDMKGAVVVAGYYWSAVGDGTDKRASLQTARSSTRTKIVESEILFNGDLRYPRRRDPLDQAVRNALQAAVPIPGYEGRYVNPSERTIWLQPGTTAATLTRAATYLPPDATKLVVRGEILRSAGGPVAMELHFVPVTEVDASGGVKVADDSDNRVRLASWSLSGRFESTADLAPLFKEHPHGRVGLLRIVVPPAKMAQPQPRIAVTSMQAYRSADASQ